MKAPRGGHKPRRFLIPLFVVGLVASLSGLTTDPGAVAAPSLKAAGVAQAAPATAATASGFLFYKFPQSEPACETGALGLNVTAKSVYSRDDCGFAQFVLSESVPEGSGQGRALRARRHDPLRRP